MSRFAVGDLVTFDLTNPMGLSQKALERWANDTFIVENVSRVGYLQLRCNEKTDGHFSSIPPGYVTFLQREPLTEEDIL